jgi:hypothetical protein
MRTLDRERFEVGVDQFLDSPFGAELGESLTQDGTLVWHLGKRRGFDPRTFMRLARILDRFGPRVGSALSLHPQGLAPRAPALDKHEGLY